MSAQNRFLRQSKAKPIVRNTIHTATGMGLDDGPQLLAQQVNERQPRDVLWPISGVGRIVVLFIAVIE
jgi:hypothetical protein